MSQLARDLYPLAGRKEELSKSIVEIDRVKIGAGKPVIMAGPCAVEDREQIFTTARTVKESGGEILRGGVFKPRTSPYSFQGLGKEGLELLAEVKEETGLLIVTEVMDVRDIDLVAEYADILQIGSRNMQHYPLLREVGKVDMPVLLKRGMTATIKEWLLAAEYILRNGNQQVILCERGIRGFQEYTRNILDISAVPVVRQLSHLPIIIDPSHATGHSELVTPLAKAGVIAGADGVMVEVHPNPEQALCDGEQSLDLPTFQKLVRNLKLLPSNSEQEI
ncbi:3-deoxy-7-phosphoheptulonate synthase [Selenihalanaerobacter shriftii]|uniref:3-deoxy-D-arabinoheptulosonate-7-phosphate synthase n=1 Tax=Selenihalanaerobacter shriftii TaxID=142842 RepID=A0A1T4JPI8_9FIRM|nr:3-deoxy-7-phosphoheptulonate synthase [Selenihalanaerobacter shriftii]SJZ32142.1 3-deoxy-D-arabinoheptulosonate-7-phosphate synthase [Selenihalanaerobacter shriftii]